MNATRSLLLAGISLLASTMPAAAGSALLLSSREFQADIYAETDASGRWCRPDLALALYVKPFGHVASSPRFRDDFLSAQLGPLLRRQCPEAITATVFEHMTSTPTLTWATLFIARSADWYKPARVAARTPPVPAAPERPLPRNAFVATSPLPAPAALIPARPAPSLQAAPSATVTPSMPAAQTAFPAPVTAPSAAATPAPIAMGPPGPSPVVTAVPAAQAPLPVPVPQTVVNVPAQTMPRPAASGAPAVVSFPSAAPGPSPIAAAHAVPAVRVQPPAPTPAALTVSQPHGGGFFSSVLSMLFNILFFAGIIYFIYRQFIRRFILGGGGNLGAGLATAQWAGRRALRDEGMLSDPGAGVVLGDFQKSTVVSNGSGGTFEHVLVCSPPGGGKGIGIIQPTLLTYRGSSVTLDPKGENFAKCAGAMERMGIEVRVIDPWGISGRPTQSINPLANVSPDDEDLVDHARAIANTLVTRSNEKDAYWDDQAVTVITSLLIGVITFGDEGVRDLVALRELINMPDRATVFAAMAAHNNPIVRNAATAIMDLSSNEKGWASVWSIVRKSTDFLDSPKIQATLRGKSFDPAEMRIRNIAIFLIIPGEKMASHGVVARAWLNGITRPLAAAREYPGNRPPILFMLDEVFTRDLGKIEALETQLTLFRSVGIRLCLITQTLGQIAALYGDDGAKTIIASTRVKTFFGISDHETAEQLSSSLGEREHTTVSASVSKNGPWHKPQKSRSISTSVQTRALLSTDEILRLSSEKVIVLKQGMAPAMLERISVFKDKRFASLLKLPLGVKPMQAA